MGDYYSLRFTAALTPEGAAAVREVLATHSWRGVNEEYSNMPRASFIPFGGLVDAPEGWVQARDVQSVGEMVIWHVCCSIKVNTDSTVFCFLRLVLPPMLLLPAKVEWYNELTNETTTWLVTPDAQVSEILESPRSPAS